MRWIRGKENRDRRAYRSMSPAVGIGIMLFFNFLIVGFLVQPKNQPMASIYGSLLLLASTLLFGRLTWSAVFASVEGIHAANIFASFDLEWTEVNRFKIGRWKLLPSACLIHLTDGRVLHASGIAETNFRNGSAEALVDELNRELTRHVPSRGEGGAQAALFRGASTKLPAG